MEYQYYQRKHSWQKRNVLYRRNELVVEMFSKLRNEWINSGYRVDEKFPYPMYKRISIKNAKAAFPKAFINQN